MWWQWYLQVKLVTVHFVMQKHCWLYIYVLVKVSTQIQVSRNALRILWTFFSCLDSPLLPGFFLSFIVEMRKLDSLTFTFFCTFFFLFEFFPRFLFDVVATPPPPTLPPIPPPNPPRKLNGRRTGLGLTFVTTRFFSENNSPKRELFRTSSGYIWLCRQEQLKCKKWKWKDMTSLHSCYNVT